MVNRWSFFSQLKVSSSCPLCAAPPANHALLCERCLADITPLGPACPRCALPLPEAGVTACGECLNDPPAFDRIHAGYRYQSPLNELIARFKYHHHLPSGRLIAELMDQTLPQSTAIDWLIPMPLHPSRLQSRGFNQTAELCRHLNKSLGIPWSDRHLMRIRPAASQREARRSQRWANVRNAFVCAPIQGRVAIVDDVVTTGATARATAKAVKQAGASWVEVWALARTARLP